LVASDGLGRLVGRAGWVGRRGLSPPGWLPLGLRGLPRRTGCWAGADKPAPCRPSTCGNCAHLHELHDFRGHVGDPAHDHRKGRHRAWRAV